MSAQSIGVQGSGWGWLGYSKERQRVEILTKPNQDPLTELVPLLGFDVSVLILMTVRTHARAGRAT